MAIRNRRRGSGGAGVVERRMDCGRMDRGMERRMDCGVEINDRAPAGKAGTTYRRIQARGKIPKAAMYWS